MIYLICGLLGAVFGSFAGAQVWRLRAQQLAADDRAGEKVDQRELTRLRPLGNQQLGHDRSRCLHCQRVLAWYDLLPVVSWLLLRGRCRYCRRPIGWSELLLELGLAGLFVASVALWPGGLTDAVQVGLLVLWLVALVLLAILFVYDVRWMLLPDVINWPFIGLGALFGQ